MKHLHEIEVTYKSVPSQQRIITSSYQANELTHEIYELSNAKIDLKEYFFIILLNRRNKVISYYKLSEGGISGTIADIRLAFSTALKCVSTAMILVHNHPSGQLKPSDADEKLTKQFIDAGKILDILILDHIIVTSNNGYYSFADEGKI
jgi:DNA repair protein RadC